MGYYNNIIGQGLANKLAAAGMELKPVSPTFDYETDYEAPVYAVVFDWFIKNGLSIEVQRGQGKWFAIVVNIESGKWQLIPREGITTWREMANEAIEKAIEILKSIKK